MRPISTVAVAHLTASAAQPSQGDYVRHMSDPTGQNPYGSGPQDSGGQVPPFQPPPGPPGGPPHGGFNVAPEPKKKRWPWILAGVFVLCFLPLGACAALIGFGFNAINDLVDEVEQPVVTMFTDASNGNFDAAGSFAEASGGCVNFEQLTKQMADLSPTGPPEITNTLFVERDGSSTLSNLGIDEADEFIVDGRTDAGAGEVTGTVPTADGVKDFRVTLVDDVVSWRVCEVTIT